MKYNTLQKASSTMADNEAKMMMEGKNIVPGGILLAIPTYQRQELLQAMARSLFASDLPAGVHIKIYDDASTDFGTEELAALFPGAEVHRHAKNIGADANMKYMYADFQQRDEAYFFNADADLIFSHCWLQQALDILPETDGCLSLLHATGHPMTGGTAERWGEKEDLGAAGVLMTRDVMRTIDAAVGGEDAYGFDHRWSWALRAHGIRLACVRQSLVQHVGLLGSNSSIVFDYGEGFTVDTAANGQIINDVLTAYAKKIQRDGFVSVPRFYRVINHLLAPVARLKKRWNRYRILHHGGRP